MFRYILALLALVGMFAMPISAQDKAGPCAPVKGVSNITTFTVFVMTFVEKGEAVLSIRVNEDGTASCRHVAKTNSDGFSKTTTTDVEATLTPGEIKSIRDVFAKMELDTLKTRELKEGEGPPEKYVVVAATNGTETARYACESDKLPLEAVEKLGPVLKVMNKLAERLK